MSVDSGVVICFSEKDYELQSWNEQGEITQIEGMLTIAFLVVSPCSHKDDWKQLYLIIKIPYLVNMSKESEEQFMKVNLDEYVELKKEIVPKLKKRIENLEGENKELKFEISLNESSFKEFAERFGIKLEEHTNELMKKIELVSNAYTKKLDELENLKIENQTLKERLGIVDSEWQFQRDLAKRVNPITKKHESYNFPLGFKESRVEHLHHPGDNEYMYEFDYYVGDWDKSKKYEQYKMSVSLYDFLCKESFELEQKKEKEEKESVIATQDGIKKHLENYGIKYYGLEYLDITIDFILENRGKTFETQFFKGQCKIDSRTTVNDYLNMFYEAKIIDKIRKGFWKVIIK